MDGRSKPSLALGKPGEDLDMTETDHENLMATCESIDHWPWGIVPPIINCDLIFRVSHQAYQATYASMNHGSALNQLKPACY